MNNPLSDFVLLLEQHRAEGRELSALLAVEPVRHLPLPLCHQSCAELRAMASVFQCDEAQLAAALLRGAMQHMRQHLDDDLDVLARQAREALDSPCHAASEAI